MDPRKPIAEHIALNILGSIENELDISYMFDTNARTLTVDLPRMGLSSCAQEGQGFLKSRNYTGMRADEDQEVGTLIGLFGQRNGHRHRHRHRHRGTAGHISRALQADSACGPWPLVPLLRCCGS